MTLTVFSPFNEISLMLYVIQHLAKILKGILKLKIDFQIRTAHKVV